MSEVYEGHEDRRVAVAYRQIAHSPEGCTVHSLASELGVRDVEVLEIGHALEERGLVRILGELLVAIPWWDEDRVEVMLDIPRVEAAVFRAYCQDIDALCASMRRSGHDVVRPYLHETALEVMVGAAVGFALGEFFKSFLAQMGRDLAAFVQRSVQKYRHRGLTHVEIKGVRNSGEFSCAFSVKGSDICELSLRLEQLAESVEQANKKGVLQQVGVGDEVSFQGEGWDVLIRKRE